MTLHAACSPTPTPAARACGSEHGAYKKQERPPPPLHVFSARRASFRRFLTFLSRSASRWRLACSASWTLAPLPPCDDCDGCAESNRGATVKDRLCRGGRGKGQKGQRLSGPNQREQGGWRTDLRHGDPGPAPLVADALGLDLATLAARREALLALGPVVRPAERLELRQRLADVLDVDLLDDLGPVRGRLLDERPQPRELQLLGQALDAQGRPPRLGVEDDDLAEAARLERRGVNVHLRAGRACAPGGQRWSDSENACGKSRARRACQRGPTLTRISKKDVWMPSEGSVLSGSGSSQRRTALSRSLSTMLCSSVDLRAGDRQPGS